MLVLAFEMSAPFAKADKPNVLLIAVDDLNDWGRLSWWSLANTDPKHRSTRGAGRAFYECPLPGDDVQSFADQFAVGTETIFDRLLQQSLSSLQRARVSAVRMSACPSILRPMDTRR